MNDRHLVRTTDGRIIAGVASGLGRYLGIDPVVLRVAFVALALLGGAGLVLYLVMWAVVPDEAGGEPVAERLLRRLSTAPAWVRVTLLVVATLIALAELGSFSVAALVVLLVAVIIVLRDGRPASSRDVTAP
jgi:phage shock protein PspC (stress-responsive transcriptional regulator)